MPSGDLPGGHAVLPGIAGNGECSSQPRAPPPRAKPPAPPAAGTSLRSFAQLEEELVKAKREEKQAAKVVENLRKKVEILERLKRLYATRPAPPATPSGFLSSSLFPGSGC